MFTGHLVLDRLNLFSERIETGCLHVKKDPYMGTIYLQDGIVVDAEVHGRKGLEAVLELLEWQEPTLVWHKDATPYSYTVNLHVNDIFAAYTARVQRAPDSLDASADPEAAAAIQIPGFEHYGVMLEALDPMWRPREFLLTERGKVHLTVGRDDSCDICLNHPTVSRVHAAILLEDGLLKLWDLGSSGATHVNECLSEDAILKAGDRVAFGDIAFRVVFRLRRPGSGPVEFRPRVKPLPEESEPLPDGAITYAAVTGAEAQARSARTWLGRLFGRWRRRKVKNAAKAGARAAEIARRGAGPGRGGKGPGAKRDR